jgi:hypothetical protein
MRSLGLSTGLFAVFLFLATAGCHNLPTASPCQTAGSQSEKAPATLFAWQSGQKPTESVEEKEKDKTSETADTTTPGEAGPNGGTGDQEPSEIATDRPDFTEASSTVGRGRIQLESGYTFSRNREAGIRDAHSYPEALLRVGLLADWFELRIGQNFSNNRLFSAESGAVHTRGSEDLYLGVKLALTEQDQFLPEMALVLQTTVPTGPRDLTAGRMLPGLNLLYGWDVVPDRLTFAGSTQGNAAVDDVGQSHVDLAQALTVGYSLTQKLGAYTEFFGFFPHGATAPDVAPEYYFNGGFTYKFTPNLQTDIRAGVGLNRHAEDFFVGTGFAVRY